MLRETREWESEKYETAVVALKEKRPACKSTAWQGMGQGGLQGRKTRQDRMWHVPCGGGLIGATGLILNQPPGGLSQSFWEARAMEEMYLSKRFALATCKKLCNRPWGTRPPRAPYRPFLPTPATSLGHVKQTPLCKFPYPQNYEKYQVSVYVCACMHVHVGSIR